MRLSTPEFGSLVHGSGLGEFAGSTGGGFGEFGSQPKAATVTPPPVGPSVVSTAAYTEITAGTTHTLTGINTQAGNAIQVIVGIRGTSNLIFSCTDSVGNTYTVDILNNNTNGSASLVVFHTTNASPAALVAGSITVTFLSALTCVFRYYECSGVHNIAPLDQHSNTNSNNTTSTTPASGATPALTAVNQLTFGAVVNDYGGTARTFSAATFTSGVPTTSYPAATTGDNSAVPTLGLQLHSGLIKENALTGEAYSETLSTASQWAASCFSLLNGP